MIRRLDGLVPRRLSTVLRRRLTFAPVVVLTGARAVGKSVLLAELAKSFDVPAIDLDDLDTRSQVHRDPALFASGPRPVIIDEFQHVPLVLDAIKAELNQDTSPGRFVLSGSTRYETLPRAAQSLTGRATVVPVWPLSQGEIDGISETLVKQLLSGPVDPRGITAGKTAREEYVDRVLAGGYPLSLMLPTQARPQWFSDYVSLVCERDVLELSRIRQREQLPRLLTRLIAQTGQILNIADAARVISAERSTAENYTRLLESVFLIHRLPAWGTTLAAKAGAAPKVHAIDSGLAARLLRITPEKLARRSPQALTEFGHLVETFVVGEVLKQVSWMADPIITGHWRTRGGSEVDLVLERTDGSVFGIEVKASSRVGLADASGLSELARRLKEQWLGGVVFYLGSHSTHLVPEHNILAVPVDTLWSKI